MTSISPTSGPTAGGTTVTISGTNFTGTSGAGGVKFGSANATNYTVNSPTQITVTSPASAGQIGSVDVTVTSAGGTSATSAADRFTYYGQPLIILVDGGDRQSATVNTAFATRLAAVVRDGAGNGVPGVTVNFSAPGNGASGTFAGSGATATAITDNLGVATAPAFTANGVAGDYRITAGPQGYNFSTLFGLTNTPGAASQVMVSGGSGQSAAVGSAFATPLSAVVRDSSNNPVQGVTVTFTPPGSGASGSFTGGNTAVTNASGIATANAFTANNISGNYNVTASVAGVNTPANFALTNNAGAANQIAVTAGGGQSATINTAFATALSVVVRDASNNPVPGITVTFTPPSAGASGAFTGGNTAVTNTSGIATANAFTANGTAGNNYTVTATATGGSNPSTNFTLTNTPGATSQIAAISGSGQSATINTAFATILSATVRDANNNPVSGINVTFTAPNSGASGTFAGGGITATTASNSSGVATAPVFTANSTAGNYNVSATAPNVNTPANFALTNMTGAASQIYATSGSGQSAIVNTAFANALTATVRDVGNNPVSGVTVTFTAPNAGASGTFAGGGVTVTAVTSPSGVASAPTLTANAILGNYTVTASVPNINTQVSRSPAPPANFSLTNTSTAPQVTTNPASVSVNAGQTATFTAGASGAPTPTVQWQVSSNGGGSFSDIAGATNTTLSFAAQTGDNGKLYRAVFTNTGGSARTTAATLTVNAAPGVTTNPTSQTVLTGSNASFTAAATGSPAPTVQWQVSTNGGGSFANVLGATATTLSFSARTADNGNQYRAVFTNSAGSAMTSAATLTVTPIQATTTTLASSVNPSTSGQAVTFTATVTAASGTPTGNVTFSDGGTPLGTAALAGGMATFTTSALGAGAHTITAAYGGVTTFAASTSAGLTQSVGTPIDSVRLRQLQVLVTPIVAQVSGQAIAGAIDSAIGEGFSGGGTFVSPSGGGVRFNFAADPEAPSALNVKPRNSDPFSSVSGSLAATGRGANSNASTRFDDGFNALGYASQTRAKAPPRQAADRDWLGWAEIRGAVLDRWNVSTTFGAPLATASMLYGNQVNMLAGLSRRFTPNFLIGVLGGYETFDYRSDALSGHLKGEGWSAGAYAGWMISSSIRADAAIVYSGIGYDGTSGQASGSFTGRRVLASGGLVGSYVIEGFRVEPSARVFALWERENAYTDSLGTQQGARNFSTGRGSSGLKVAYPINWSDAVTLSPYAGLYGDYYFNTDSVGPLNVVPGAIPTGRAFDGWSARAIGGVAASFINGAQINVGAERSGLGGPLGLWVYRARGSMPFAAR